MKLAFSTLGCPGWTFDQVMRYAQEKGYAGLEIRGVDGEMAAERIARFSQENAPDTRNAVHAHGLALCGFGTSVRFDDAQKYGGMIQQGKSAIDACRRMGIPWIRVFGDQVPEGEKESSVIARVASGIGELCAYARDSGVQVYLETHGQFNTLERIQGVCAAVAQDNFGIIWDVAHTDKVYGDDFLAFYEPMKPMIRHLHFKDHKRVDGGFVLCRLGEGDIPIESIVRTVLKDGYAGYYSLEWEKLWHPELAEPEVAFEDFTRLMTSLNSSKK